MPRGVPLLAAPSGRPGSRSPGASARASAVRAIDNSLNSFAHIASTTSPGGAPKSQGEPAAPASAKAPVPASYALWSGTSGSPSNAGPSNPVASSEFPASALKEWVASHNLEISRTHPDREDSPWDYIGHRFPREKSPGTAVHSTVLTEGRWAAEFKILECKGNSGNGMYLGVTDGGSSLTQEKGGRAWVLDLNEGKLRTFIDGFNIGCNGVGMSGRKLMRGDMKCVCKGAKIYFELDMRHRSLAVEAVPMGKALAGSLTHARVELPSSVRLVVGLFQGHDAVQFVGLTRLPTDESDPPPPPPQAQRLPTEKPGSLSRSNTFEAGVASSSDAAAASDAAFDAATAPQPFAPPGARDAISPSELDDDNLSARDRDLPPQIGTPPDSPPPQSAAAPQPKRAAPAALPSERAKKASRLGGLGASAAAPAAVPGSCTADMAEAPRRLTPSPSDDDDGEALGAGGPIGDSEGAVAMHEERMRCRRAELQELKSLLTAKLVTDENYVNEVQRVLEKHQF